MIRRLKGQVAAVVLGLIVCILQYARLHKAIHFVPSDVEVLPTNIHNQTKTLSLMKEIELPKVEMELDSKQKVSVIDSLDIRTWGCNRKEEVFTFVHIGKSGGGNIRPRIAFAALNVTRWRWQGWDEHYYPMEHGRGKFCNSKMANHRIQNTNWPQLHEGMIECNATTPLSMMVGCPGTHHDCGNCRTDQEFCGTVYVGHNVLGTEVHWLNHFTLKQWWTENGKHLYPKVYDDVLSEIELQHHDRIWCEETQDKIPTNQHRKYRTDQVFREKCSHPRTKRFDAMLTDTKNYAPLYASLPVLRSVVLREPWSWILSKFFWHKREVSCEDIDAAVEFNETKQTIPVKGPGWLKHDAYSYLFYLCGEDCISRYEYNLATLEELETQAADNLRSSFAVVGLLEDQEMFFDMLDARVDYLNMSLSTDFKGNEHKSFGGAEKERCKQIYKEESFRNRIKEKLPVMGTLERLYKIAVEVNEVHQDDLRSCSAEFREKYPAAVHFEEGRKG